MRRLITETSKIKIVNNLIVLVLAVYGLSQKRFDLEEMTLFQTLVVEVVGPVQKGITSGRDELDALLENYLRIVNTSKENFHLKEKISRLERDLFQMEEIRRENLRLKQLMRYSEDIGHDQLLAQVVGWDSANQFKVLRLNRGEDDGVRLMAPVITHHGLVGYVYRLGPRYADVLTILDPNNRVDALIERTRTHGIVEGVFNHLCTLKYVNRNEAIEVGDKLMTAGVGGIYPKGIKVGMVTAVDREAAGMTLGVEITPTVDFHKLEEVLVLLPRLATTAAAVPATPPSIQGSP